MKSQIEDEEIVDWYHPLIPDPRARYRLCFSYAPDRTQEGLSSAASSQRDSVETIEEGESPTPQNDMNSDTSDVAKPGDASDDNPSESTEGVVIELPEFLNKPIATERAPCGGGKSQNGNLWSWFWAGENHQYTIIDRTRFERISHIQDLSGNGHHYYDQNSLNPELPKTGPFTYTKKIFSYINPETNQQYLAPFPVIGLNFYDYSDSPISGTSGKNLYSGSLHQLGSFDAEGEFYIALALLNSRTDGTREILGSSLLNNISYAQGAGIVNVIINGKRVSTEKGSFKLGTLLIEIYRDTNHEIHILVNGVEKSRVDRSLMINNDLFELSGFGWVGSGTSFFDDTFFEGIICKGSIPKDQQLETREYLRTKWQLY